MSKRCARCEKAVYPLEELKCLDKIWHKGCFKCEVCAMTLSMKTYKGFNKKPYCEAHIPKAKATTVAETPEMRRLAENTKIQSNVQYHADFEKNKAKFTQVADDPETQRLKKNTQIISNVVYHGDLEKKSEMERRRVEPENQNDERTWSHDAIGGGHIATAKASAHQTIASLSQHEDYDSQDLDDNISNLTDYIATHDRSPSPARHHPAAPYHASSGSSRKSNEDTTTLYPQSYYQVPPPASHVNTNSYYPDQPVDNNGYYPPHTYTSRQPDNGYYHPANGSAGAYHSTNRHSASYSNYPTNNHYAMQQQPSRRVGSIADYDPVNEQYGSITQPTGGGYRQEATYQVQRTNLYGDQGPPQQPQQQQQQQPAPAHLNNVAPHQKVNAPPTQLGRCYRAMYDYEAADTDEVSFRDGDLIINCTAIDEGWMTGTIQRTGNTGMLPANYVERVS